MHGVRRRGRFARLPPFTPGKGRVCNRQQPRTRFLPRRRRRRYTLLVTFEYTRRLHAHTRLHCLFFRSLIDRPQNLYGFLCTHAHIRYVKTANKTRKRGSYETVGLTTTAAAAARFAGTTPSRELFKTTGSTQRYRTALSRSFPFDFVFSPLCRENHIITLD